MMVPYIKWGFWQGFVVIAALQAFGENSFGALGVLCVLVPFLTGIAMINITRDERAVMPFEVTAAFWIALAFVLGWNHEYLLALCCPFRVIFEAARCTYYDRKQSNDPKTRSAGG